MYTLPSYKTFSVSTLVVLFAVGSWLNLSGVWIEFPLIINDLPEGWRLPVIMGLISNVANVGVVIIAVIRLFSSGRVSYEIPVNIFILATGTIVLVILAFVWNKTSTINGKEYSTYLMGFSATLSLVDCTSSVTFLPFLDRYEPKYVNAYFLGEALSSLLPAIVGMVQGVGQIECVQYNNTSTERITPPRFSVKAYFLALSAIMLASLVSFIILCLTRMGKRKDEVSIDSLNQKQNTFVVELNTSEDSTDKEFSIGKEGYAVREVSNEKEGYAEREVSIGKEGFAEKEVSIGKEGFAEKEVSIGKEGYAEREVSNEKEDFVEKEVSIGKEGYAEREVSNEKEDFVEKEVSIGKEGYAEREVSNEKEDFVEKEVSIGKEGYAEREVSNEKEDFAEKEASIGKEGFAEKEGYTEKKDPMEIESRSEMTYKEFWLSEHGIYLFLCFWTSILIIGATPSIQSYSLNPYSIEVYHHTLVACQFAYPLMSLLGVFIPRLRSRYIYILTAVGSGLFAYTFIAALRSPCSPLIDRYIGKVVIALSWVFKYLILYFVRILLGNYFRRTSGHRGLFWFGVLTQIGSLVGAAGVFLLTNILNLFVEREICGSYKC